MLHLARNKSKMGVLMNIDDHVKEVFKWLDENVQKFETPSKITLHGFQADPERFKGEFRVTLDDVLIGEAFQFHLSANGKPTFCPPMFYSPLGAPASYAAVQLTDETVSAIQKVMESALPMMRPLGLQPDGSQLFYGGPIEERILDEVEFRQKFSELAGGYFSLAL